MSAADADASSDSPLWQRLVSVYHTALENGDVFKTETDDKVFVDPALDVGFVLRVAASLNSKPKPPKTPDSGGKPANPFLQYSEALWVAHLSDTHTCLLNKFNLVPYHTLVVTRQFEEQTSALTAADFDATLQVLQAMPQGGIAYFNCGPESGASQPHKHVQVVPLPLMKGLPAELPFHAILAAGTESGNGGGNAAGYSELRSLPYQCSAARLQPDRLEGSRLAALADQMLRACRQRNSGINDLSYNVVLTTDYLQLIPRRQESTGPVAVNSLGPAGTFFVKHQDHLAYLEEKTLLAALSEVGFPW